MLSTDEVYGPGRPDDSVFDETHALQPASPYAASKAAADLLCSAYVVTYGAPVTIVRGTNAFGPRQIERVVPTFSICALEGAAVPVYGAGRQRREFLFVTDWVARRAHGARARRARRHLQHRRRVRTGEPGPWRGGSASWRARPSRRSRSSPTAPVTTSATGCDPIGCARSAGSRECRSTTGSRAPSSWYRDHLAWLRRAHDVPVVTEPRAAGAGR